MKNYIPYILILASGPLHADWKFGGQTGPYFQDLGIDSTTVTQGQKSGIVSDLKLEYKFESPWKFKSDLMIRTDFIARDNEEFFQLIPRNFYLHRKYGSVHFKFGLQTMAVDGPDIINPADIVHAKNWVDPTAPLTMGSPGLSFSLEKKDWNWELLYVPRQLTNALPGEHSPWLPRKNRLPIESESLTVEVPDNVQYQYLDPIEVGKALDHNVALKVQTKSENFEAQALYFNGVSQSPFLLTKVQGSLLSLNPDVILVDSPVKLQPLYYRHQAFAGTFVVPFESWALRGGINWLRPEGSDKRVPEETTLMVVGLEKSVETSMGLVTGIFDYIRQKRQNENQLSFLRSIFEEAISGGLRVPFGEETTFMGGGIYDLVGHSSLLKFNINHRLTNSWSVDLGAQFLQGPENSLLGIYQKYDSYQLKFLFSW